MSLALSVLDLSPIPSGASARDALRNTIDLASYAESLGYVRYWLAEHHNAGALACSTPEIMIGQVAAATRSIRVGSGGVMLPNHTPLKVAETFRVLHALFPGRIDLGLGRAPGTDPRTAAALRRSREAVAVDDFSERFDDLLHYLDDDDPPRPGVTGTIRAIPTNVPRPDVWILGSSDTGGALFAAQRGLGFAYAHHINPPDAARSLRAYRSAFVPSPSRPEPWAILAVSLVCADTDAEADRLASSGRLAMVWSLGGIRDRPLPTVNDALAYAYDADEQALLASRGPGIGGSARRVRATLLELANEAQADEVMVLTHVHSHAARKRSYELVARALASS